MITCGIYGIVCKINNKILVGSSTDINRRYSQHLWKLRRGIHNNPHLQNSYKVYGEENFEIKILEQCPKENLLEKEDWWIHSKNSLDQNVGFNFKSAARPIFSPDTCKKISEAKKGCKNPMYGRHLSKEHKDMISNALKGEKSPFYGKSPSIKTRLKMSASQTGKTLSEETKRKIGLANINKIVSEETKIKMSAWQKGEKSKNWGKKASEETKIKMSLSHKNKPYNLSDEGRKKLSELHRGKNNYMFGKKPSKETIEKRKQTRLNNIKLEQIEKTVK
jgi:group I intron endonuclease